MVNTAVVAFQYLFFQKSIGYILLEKNYGASKSLRAD